MDIEKFVIGRIVLEESTNAVLRCDEKMFIESRWKKIIKHFKSLTTINTDSILTSLKNTVENESLIESVLESVDYAGKYKVNLDEALNVLDENVTAANFSAYLKKKSEEVLWDKKVIEIVPEIIEHCFVNKLGKAVKITKIDEDFSEVNTELIDFGKRRPLLNKVLITKKSILTIGGDSNHHKTNQVIDIIINALIANPNFKAVFFSSDMSFNRVRARFYASMLNKSLSDITTRKLKVKDLISEIKSKFPNIENRFLIIAPEQLKDIKDIVRILNQEQPDIWALDFIQFFAQGNIGGGDTNENVIKTMSQIKPVVHATNTLAILISQVRKKSESRLIHFPRVDDLEYAGLIKQISDNIGLCFWPYKIDTRCDKHWFGVAWAKTRDAEGFGEVLYVEPETCSFTDHPKGQSYNRQYFQM